MQLKNKLLIVILCCAVLFSMIFVSYSYGTDSTDSVNTLEIDGYDMSDIYNYVSTDDNFFICTITTASGYWCYIPSESQYRYYISVSGDNITYYNSSWSKPDSSYCNFYQFNTSTLKWEQKFYGNTNAWSLSQITVVYSTSGIYNEDHTTFFMEPPVQPTLLEIAEETLEVTLVQQTMGTQLTTLIKVGLIIFGLLLAPFLIKLRS